MEKLLTYLDSNKEKHLSELYEFLKIPSISTEPESAEDVRKCANWLKSHIENFGLENCKLIETSGHPIVYGEWLKAGANAPTILIYGHYDVQPVDPIELWTSAPFEPEVRNGKIFGRGTADDKGQVFTHVKAIESYLKANGSLPVNVKLLIEGEEESGSDNLEKFIASNTELLKCDTIVISDTEWFTYGMPSIVYSLRGLTYIEVFVTGPNRDLHSGTFGGAVDNPVNVLATIISKLKDDNNKITIPGFYDAVLELTEDERDGFKKLPFDEVAYCKDLDVAETNGEKGYSTMERAWARPTLDVNGIVGGYTGEGAKTVLPSKASAKISMRLVPNQNSADIAKKASEYIKQIAPPTVKVEVKLHHGGEPVLVPRDSIGVEAAMKALKAAFGEDPVFMREGGSIPIVSVFSDELKAPTVLMGFGLPDDNIHSPDESFALENFYGGIKTSAIFIDEFSKMFKK